jgi:hypothetical protein
LFSLLCVFFKTPSISLVSHGIPSLWGAGLLLLGTHLELPSRGGGWLLRLFTTTTLLLRQSSSSPNFCFLYYAVDPTSWKLFSSGAWFYSSRPTLQGPAFTSIILSRNHSMDLFSIRTLSLRHYPAGSNNIVLFLFLCCARRKEKKEKKKKPGTSCVPLAAEIASSSTDYAQLHLLYR